PREPQPRSSGRISAAGDVPVHPRELFIGVDRVAIVADGKSAEIEAIDGDADTAGAAVAEDELADAGMHAAELAGEDAIDDATAGKNIGGTAAQRVLDAGNPHGEAGPGTAEDRAVADFGPDKHLCW